MVERSRSAELFVDDNLAQISGLILLAHFMRRVYPEHVPRVRQIHLPWITSEMMTALFGHLPRTSLQLHSLELGCSPADGRPTFRTEVIRTKTLLRTLRVQNCDKHCPFQP